MTLIYRRAVPSDVAACIELRGKTRENAVSVERLNQLGVTHASWSAGVANGDLQGYVCCDKDQIVGYVFADMPTGEVVVLALLPEWEGRGIGKCLLQMIVWKSTGTFDANHDEVLELLLEASSTECELITD